MIAYKFLRRGAVGPFSRFGWPAPAGGRPGEWVRASGKLVPCGNGVHACRTEHLPLWIFDELWEVELDSPVRTAPTLVVARAGRLRARIDRWNSRAAADFAAACAERVGALGDEAFAQDAATWARSAAEDEKVAVADSACVAYIAAHAAGERGGQDAELRERAWQARWLAGRLELSARPFG